MLQFGSSFFPVEIKSGMTINRDYFKGLKKIAKVLELPLGSGLIYGGSERQKRADTWVHPVSDISLLISKIEKLSSQV